MLKYVDSVRAMDAPDVTSAIQTFIADMRTEVALPTATSEIDAMIAGKDLTVACAFVAIRAAHRNGGPLSALSNETMNALADILEQADKALSECVGDVD